MAGFLPFLNQMKIEDCLKILKINAKGIKGEPMTIYPVLVWDKNNAIIIDTAFPSMSGEIQSAVEKCIQFSRINKIIITHHDIDHVGCLESLIKESGNRINIMAHKFEEPYITGEMPSIKFTPEHIKKIKKQIAKMPEDQRKNMEQMFTKKSISIDTYLNDGDELPFCGGITVIHTPGHTPGHISLYLNKYKTLVSGDAMILNDGMLSAPVIKQTYDIKEALKSLKKFTEFDIETVICFHGGIFTEDPDMRIKELSHISI